MIATVPSPRVSRVLRNLAADPGLLEAFAVERADLFNDLPLTAEDREFLRTVDPAGIRAEQCGAEQSMGTGETEPSMGSGSFEPSMSSGRFEPSMGSGAFEPSMDG